MVQVQIASELCSTTRDISLQWNWFQLSDKLYEYTGISPKDMKIVFGYDNGTSVEVVRSSWDNQTLARVLNSTLKTIEVYDTNQNSIASQLAHEMDDDSTSVPAFEISEEAYEQRTDSVLNWKKKLQVGKFNPEYTSQVVRDREIQKEHAGQLTINERCSINTSNYPERRGWLRFVGVVPQINADDLWCGVEFDEPVGKNDGTFAGHVYFGPVKPNYGGFVKPSSVKTSPDFHPLLDDEDFISSDEI